MRKLLIVGIAFAFTLGGCKKKNEDFTVFNCLVGEWTTLQCSGTHEAGYRFDANGTGYRWGLSCDSIFQEWNFDYQLTGEQNIDITWTSYSEDSVAGTTPAMTSTTISCAGGLLNIGGETYQD